MLCPQLCMGTQPGACYPALNADAPPAILYGHFTQAIAFPPMSGEWCCPRAMAWYRLYRAAQGPPTPSLTLFRVKA